MFFSEGFMEGYMSDIDDRNISLIREAILRGLRLDGGRQQLKTPYEKARRAVQDALDELDSEGRIQAAVEKEGVANFDRRDFYVEAEVVTEKTLQECQATLTVEERVKLWVDIDEYLDGLIILPDAEKIVREYAELIGQLRRSIPTQRS